MNIKNIITKLMEFAKVTFTNIKRLIAVDGLLHILVSALLLVTFYGIKPDMIGASIMTIGLGIFKEVYDKTHNGSATWHDIICDFIGICVGLLICLLYQ